MAIATENAHRLVSAARDLGPLIQRYAVEIEETRELPRPLFETLADAGLFHMILPRALGGEEIDLPSYLDVVEELGKHDASTAWCINQASSFVTYAPCFTPEVARLVFVDTPRGVVANTPAPVATAIPVAGGYRVSGRHAYGTGCHHASWMASRGHVVVDGEKRTLPDGKPDIRYFLLPVEETELLDTWKVRGLRGTGTHDWVVADRFVPEERTISPDAIAPPGTGAIYVIPRQMLAAAGDAATALGVARSCLDAFIELAGGKQAANVNSLVREEPLVQFDVGFAEAELRSSKALLAQTAREVWAAMVATDEMTLEDRASMRLAAVHAIRKAAAVVDSMYNAAGATAVLESHPIQRQFQDIHVITQHMQARRSHYELVGKVLLGYRPESNFL